MIKKINLKLLLSCALLGAWQVQAQEINTVINIKSADQFQDILDDSDLVVALFYQKTEADRNNIPLNRRINRLKDLFKETAQKQEYVESDITFVAVNLSKSDLVNLARDHRINRVPTVAVFINGRQVRPYSGQPATLIGYMTADELEHFIDSHLREYLPFEEQPRPIGRVVRQYTVPSYNYSSYSPVYWGYPRRRYYRPYWHYPYYGNYGYPRAGFGIGFGIGGPGSWWW